jgi:hypothetical protein
MDFRFSDLEHTEFSLLFELRDASETFSFLSPIYNWFGLVMD